MSLKVKFSTKINPSELTELTVSEISITSQDTTLYLKQELLEIAPGVTVCFDDGAIGLQVKIDNDNLADLVWDVSND
jgi:hypothetical protein